MTSIGDYTFYGCQNLKSVELGSGVISIGLDAFGWCNSLCKLVLPASLKELGVFMDGYASREELLDLYFTGDAPTLIGGEFEGIWACCVAHLPKGNYSYEVVDGKWQGLAVEWYDLTSVPTIEGDGDVEVTGDADNGYIIKPGEHNTEVVVTIPEGVEPEKVTVEVAADVETVTANGANVRVMKGEHDIAEHLDLEAVTQDGVINLASAQVKEEVVKEALDTEKGAEVDISDPDSPELTTSETKPGLTYTLLEGETLEAMMSCTDGDSKVGDGKKWRPTIKVKGGTSGFYTIKVEK